MKITEWSYGILENSSAPYVIQWSFNIEAFIAFRSNRDEIMLGLEHS